MDLVLMIGAFGALMYFLMIRPQQKRMKAHQATLGSLAPGTRVLLTSGVFATVRHLGERQAIVELAPGMEITIIKGNIARPTTADEEEFEFSDEADIDVLDEDVFLEGADLDDAGSDDVLADEVLLPEDMARNPGGDAEVSFDPRSDRDISAEELQRRFDN